MYGCDNLCLLNMYAMALWPCVMGKRSKFLKTLEKIIIGVFPSHRKMPRGQHIYVYVQKKLFLISTENCWSRSVSLAALSCISSHLYPSALMPHVKAHDGWWEGCDGVWMRKVPNLSVWTHSNPINSKFSLKPRKKKSPAFNLLEC